MPAPLFFPIESAPDRFRSWSALLPVTGGAIRKTTHPIGACEPLALPFGRLPCHRGDLIGRPQIGRRIAMAVEAPAHRQRCHLIVERHLIDAAVAGHASDALVHMDGVIEIHVVRYLMHPVPPERLV